MHRSISFTAVRHGRSLEIAGRHRAILSTSAASAVIFRTAAALWAISNASRPVTTASARTARWPMQLVRLSESRTVERRQLNWYEQQFHGQRRRARERGDMGRSIHDHAIDFTSDVRRVAVKRVPRETNDSEAPRQPFLRPHLGPLERAALRVRIDYGDVPSPVGPKAGGVQRQHRLADPVRLVEERDDHGSRS